MVDMLAAIFTDCHFADTLSQEVLVTRQAGTYSEGEKLPCRFGAPRARIWKDTIPVQNWNVAMSRAAEVGLLDQPQHWRDLHLHHRSYPHSHQQSQGCHLYQRLLLVLPLQPLNQSHVPTHLYVFP